MHLFLSPHFDDAVYSCGGLLHRLAQAGETVRVYTVMGALPPDPLPDSPIVQELHARWQATDPVATRRLEDETALHALNAEAAYNSLIPDAIYRLSPARVPLYPAAAALFATVQPDDPALRLLIAKIPNCHTLWQRILFDDVTGAMSFEQNAAPPTVYAPLAAGQHVDHQIVRDWALVIARAHPEIHLRFYEDYPYIREPAALHQALAAFPHRLTAHTVHLTDEAVQAKMQGIAAYRSQFSSFWQDEADLRQDLLSVLRRTGDGIPAERLYSLAEDGDTTA
ncbi:MAG: PIG-L family deacetylase [Anaerolineae bacterium]|nr:PIG-L family deacetylase [Anaerolineae bacterium]